MYTDMHAYASAACISLMARKYDNSQPTDDAKNVAYIHILHKSYRALPSLCTVTLM